MSSAFLVFDLVGRNATCERECNTGGCIQPELNDGKEAVRLIVRQKGWASSGG